MSAKAVARRSEARKVRTRRNLLVVIGVVPLAVGGWLLWSAVQSTQTLRVPSSGVVGTNVRDIAPDFTVPTLDGSTFTLSEQRGKPAIVFFMAYWCGTCIPEARALAQLQQEYGGNLSIVTLDVDPTSTPEALAQFKRAAGDGAFVWAFDASQQVATSYQVRSLDTTYVLDGAGVILYRDEHPSSYESLKEALAQAGL